MTKISVCLATFNGAKYIKKQLDSILKQLGEFDEVIISDDHSNDETLSEIKSFNDSRINIYLNNKSKGYTRNFENSLEKATGDIIFLSDQDDIWCDDKVGICLKALNKYDFVVHDGQIVDSDLGVLKKSIFEFRNVKKGILSNFISIKYLGCCMAFKSIVLKKALPFPQNFNLVSHDSWLTLIAESYFSTTLINQKLILYRRHENNTSLGGAKGNNSLYLKLKIRLYSACHLILNRKK